MTPLTKNKKMNITITNVKNANELDQFTPVEGEWFIEYPDHGEAREQDIVESVKNYMDADYPMNVQIFHANGRAITSELPANGTFLATRTRK